MRDFIGYLEKGNNGNFFKEYVTIISEKLTQYASGTDVDLEELTNSLKSYLGKLESAVIGSDFESEILKKNKEYFYREDDQKYGKRDYESLEQFMAREERLSDDPLYILGELYDSDKIIEKDFENIKLAFPEEIIQKTSMWANQVAHKYKNEISKLADTIDFMNDKDKKFFGKNLFFAYQDYKNDEDKNYNFDIDKAIEELSNISDANGNLNYSENLDKLYNLASKHFKIKKENKNEFIRKFVQAFKLEEHVVDNFEIKTLAAEAQLLYQDKEEKRCQKENEDIGDTVSTITFILDDTKKAIDNKPTYRIITLNREEYEKYIKYNNNTYLPASLTEYYDKKYGGNYINQNNSDRIEDINKKITDEMSKKDINVADEAIFRALYLGCSASGHHIKKEDLDEFLKNNNIKNVVSDRVSPMLQSMAFYGEQVCDTAPDGKKQTEIKKILKDEETRCNENRKKYADDQEKFNKNYNMTDIVKAALGYNLPQKGV